MSLRYKNMRVCRTIQRKILVRIYSRHQRIISEIFVDTQQGGQMTMSMISFLMLPAPKLHNLCLFNDAAFLLQVYTLKYLCRSNKTLKGKRQPASDVVHNVSNI